MSMKASRSAKVNFSLYEYGSGTKLPHPRELCDVPKCERNKWISQSIADSIWVLYEFATQAERDAFVTAPPPNFPKPTLKPQSFYDHWTADL